LAPNAEDWAEAKLNALENGHRLGSQMNSDPQVAFRDGARQMAAIAIGAATTVVGPEAYVGRVLGALRFGKWFSRCKAAKSAIPQVLKNKAAGDAFRDEMASALRNEGRDVATEVYKKTPFGKRFIDIEVSLDGEVLGGVEAKVGGSRYTLLQRVKDTWLRLVEDYPVNVVRDR